MDTGFQLGSDIIFFPLKFSQSPRGMSFGSPFGGGGGGGIGPAESFVIPDKLPDCLVLPILFPFKPTGHGAFPTMIQLTVRLETYGAIFDMMVAPSCTLSRA